MYLHRELASGRSGWGTGVLFILYWSHYVAGMGELPFNNEMNDRVRSDQPYSKPKFLRDRPELEKWLWAGGAILIGALIAWLILASNRLMYESPDWLIGAEDRELEDHKKNWLESAESRFSHETVATMLWFASGLSFVGLLIRAVAQPSETASRVSQSFLLCAATLAVVVMGYGNFFIFVVE